MGTRKASLAGSWYPKQAKTCEGEIDTFLKDTRITRISDKHFIGGVVPHAGWIFSGSIACNVIHHLVDSMVPDVIVIFGMHLHPNSPAYIMKDGSWETPFGELQVDTDFSSELEKQFSFQIETADSFIQDNTIEVQLPFIKYFFSGAKIVPIGVPPRNTSLDIGKAAADISRRHGLNIRIIGSTDLTHYGHDYGFVPKGTGSDSVRWVQNDNDRRVIDLMLDMRPEEVIQEALTQQNACCPGAAATAITAAKHLGSQKAFAIAYATSYDKQPSDSFVGYTGIVF